MAIEITQSSAQVALIGGLLIGGSASLLLLFNGRIAGVSGIARRILNFKKGDISWRIAFLFGLGGGGFFLSLFFPEKFLFESIFPLGRMAAAGLLVGFGTSLGGGCTSGHGVCGVARLSKRSIVATLIFMCTGFITVFALRTLGVSL